MLAWISDYTCLTPLWRPTANRALDWLTPEILEVLAGVDQDESPNIPRRWDWRRPLATT